MLPPDEIEHWAGTAPQTRGDLPAARIAHCEFWQRGHALLRRLPPKSRRSAAESAAAAAILAAARAARVRFLRRHAPSVYDALTAQRSRFLRLDELCRSAAAAYPGLVPAASDLEAEARAPQRDKDGLEIDQGLFLAQVLADPAAGAHLCHAMLLPREAARARLAEFERSGEIDFGPLHLKRRGKASVLTLKNPRVLNAEDETTLEATEIAVDLALLDPQTEVCVLRGGPIPHPRYAGRRVFGAGINLTHLYQGKIPYLWYLVRDLGYVNKLYRGLARPEASPEEDSIEKLWVAAVEGFAIGGHCQILLAVDYTIAADDAYLTLPARKEGIVPGAANLRLPRFVGDRIARQAVMAERRIDCASAEGRLICDAIVRPEDMDAAIERTVEGLTGSGVVSAASNRRAFRAAQEPLDVFRRYMSVYAREQAYCHFSPALIANLERHWTAASRVR
ncbi:MAG: enoyl-CoA hydratase/isomerase family protein [Betaproteobacteria bacterium]|nr:MAG: enoyl-CoA hydratase/isomerase family protein [Betaproteobacteria bacterium]